MAVLVSRLMIIADQVDEATSLALHDTANFILQLIRIYAPVDTGWLRDSYEKKTIEQLHIMIGTMVLYAIYQEYGTTKMAAQPHMTPAFWQSREYYYQQWRKRLMEMS